jgi:hypothetical protein
LGRKKGGWMMTMREGERERQVREIMSLLVFVLVEKILVAELMCYLVVKWSVSIIGSSFSIKLINFQSFQLGDCSSQCTHEFSYTFSKIINQLIFAIIHCIHHLMYSLFLTTITNY